MTGFSGPPPPPPPPLPPNLPSQKVSPFVLKTRAAPPGWFNQPPEPPRRDVFATPTGPYFFYGTLMDPQMLLEILGLDPDSKPELRPGRIYGYSTKLWGQYPALVNGPAGSVVEGMVYNVRTTEAGDKLAAYETRNYKTRPVWITYLDGKQPEKERGMAFLFAGDPEELSEGEFDLKVWLRRMGRGEAVDAMEDAKSEDA